MATAVVWRAAVAAGLAAVEAGRTSAVQAVGLTAAVAEVMPAGIAAISGAAGEAVLFVVASLPL